MKTEGTVSSVLDQQTTNPINEGYIKTDFRLLINGRLVEGAGTLDVINPATGRVLTTAPRADRAPAGSGGGRREGGVPRLVGDTAPGTGRLLVKLAEALEADQDEFARLLTEEQGKPLPQALRRDRLRRSRRSATSPRSTCRSRCSRRMPRRRSSGSTSRSASSRRSRRGTSRCSS